MMTFSHNSQFKYVGRGCCVVEEYNSDLRYIENSVWNNAYPVLAKFDHISIISLENSLSSSVYLS